jgi:Ca-activated chloride channel homolog
MPVTDTMRRPIRHINPILFLILAACLPAAAGRASALDVEHATQSGAQTATKPAQSVQAPQIAQSQAGKTQGNGGESQLPLTVDRDPVPSPDDLPVTGAAAGRTQSIPKENGQYVLHRDVDEVLLNVTVLDDKDRLVPSLTKDDFKVYEDGVEQKVAVFRHEDLPVSLGILVDDSGSMQTKRSAVTKAALQMVRVSNPEDETFIVNFADEPFLDQDFTSDVGKLNEGLGHIESRGGTALYDAVAASADHMSQSAKHSRQVLLIITDGEDNDSTSTLEDTVKRVQDLGGPVVYAIGLLFDDSHGEARMSKRVLNMLAQETGGVAYFPKSLEQVDEIANEVAKDIRNQYVLGYHSTKPEALGGFRRVQVVVKAKGAGKLSVRTRTGYYPSKQGGTTGKKSAGL